MDGGLYGSEPPAFVCSCLYSPASWHSMTLASQELVQLSDGLGLNYGNDAQREERGVLCYE